MHNYRQFDLKRFVFLEAGEEISSNTSENLPKDTSQKDYEKALKDLDKLIRATERHDAPAFRKLERLEIKEDRILRRSDRLKRRLNNLNDKTAKTPEGSKKFDRLSARRDKTAEKYRASRYDHAENSMALMQMKLDLKYYTPNLQYKTERFSMVFENLLDQLKGEYGDLDKINLDQLIDRILNSLEGLPHAIDDLYFILRRSEGNRIYFDLASRELFFGLNSDGIYLKESL